MSHHTPGIRTPTFAVPAEYRRLNKYLNERFADAVVLKFGEIEDLLGFPLPEFARLQPEWWAAPAAGCPPSDQACSWLQADRTATPNLVARTVRFERNLA